MRWNHTQLKKIVAYLVIYKPKLSDTFDGRDKKKKRKNYEKNAKIFIESTLKYANSTNRGLKSLY